MNYDNVSFRLNKLFDKIVSPDFMNGTGLSNEVSYYIFDYPPEFELEVREEVKFRKDKINNGNYSFQIVEFDLYDLTYKFLDEKNFKDKFFKLEKTHGRDTACDALVKAMKLSTNDNWINKYIKENTPNNGVVFVTGVGKVFPMIRSHTIINTLHQVLDNVPVVMFFPGDYSGNSLSIFGTDSNYYRAFKF